MVLVRRLAYVASLLLIPACGQSLNKAPSPPGGDGGITTGDGGTGSKDMAGKDAAPSAIIDMAGVNKAGSPIVTIESPTATTEINTPTLPVKVMVTSPSNAVIDTSSVVLQLTPPGGAVLTAPLSPTTTPGEFSGSITLTDAITSGPATFIVEASDLNGLVGSATGSYIRDRGPQVKFVLPTSVPQKGGMVTVQIVIEDTLHPISDVSQVTVGIRSASDVTVTQVPNVTPFQVTGTFDSTDTKHFNPSLDGLQQITAQATNSKGTVGVGRQTFAIDDSGPALVIVSPDDKTFALNPITISVTVTDALSQLDTNSVYATIGGDTTKSVHLQLMGAVTMGMTGGYSGTFVGTYDLRALGTTYVYPELSVEAMDTLGNKTQLGRQILVDNTRPWLTMDGSVIMRVAKHPTGSTAWECSQPFRPLGDEALRDQQILPNIQLLNVRARIQDRGNYAPGQDVEIYSGLDPASVTMYAVPDDGKTILAVDTDADTYCDAVNPLLKPTDQVPQTGQVLALGMVARPQGSSSTPNYLAYSPAGVAGCDFYGDGNVTTAPPPTCALVQSSLDYILYSTDTAIQNTQIFMLGPVDTDTNSPSCMGRQLDTMNYFNEGWNCLITVAADVQGNSMASYPIHVCIDRGNGKCSTTSVPATDCTGIYDTTKKTIVPGTCKMPPTPTPGNPLPNPGTFPTTNDAEVYRIYIAS